jgi:hypothetical protein
VNYDNIVERKMGYRNDSDVPLLPEIHLDRTATFDQIIDESKAFADVGFKGKITPRGLLLMIRMLDKYKKNKAQWVRVATVLELIYKYLGGGQKRDTFFENRNEIPLRALMELEEFYNTDHMFMTPGEISDFKQHLDFYKSDYTERLQKQLAALKK